MSETAHLKGPNGEIGPVTNEATGEITHWGPHSTQVVCAGGAIIRLAHGEGLIPPKDGSPAIVFRVRQGV